MKRSLLLTFSLYCSRLRRVDHHTHITHTQLLPSISSARWLPAGDTATYPHYTTLV